MDLSNPLVTNDGLFKKLMSCPLKRKLVLTLIASEKDNIEEYKKNLADQKYSKNTSVKTPLKKVQKKHVCESPTALLRRRALEQRNSPEIQCSPAKKTSISSVPAVSNKILAGVVAFVDVRSKDHDRSSGVKALLNTMGATVEEEFNKQVTHVIFKDGSFSTYQRANLMNVHLVSVLWIEACRNSGVKVAEKKFPALGTDGYDHNVSVICSQLQKDYEEIIREEYSRSMITGTPLPSTRALIDKRRTTMTPNALNSTFIEKNWTQEYTSPEDREVAEINQERKNSSFPDQSHKTSSPEITEDDSDLESCIAGEMIKKKTVGLRDISTDNQSTEEHVLVSDSNISIVNPFITTGELNTSDNSQLTRKLDKSSTKNSSPKTPYEFYNRNTPKINRSRTCNNIYSDESFRNCPDSDENTCKRLTRSRRNTICLNNTVKDSSPINKNSLMQKPIYKRSISKLDMTLKQGNKRIETSSSTNISSKREYDIVDKSRSTSMSTLQLSNNQVENSTSTNMSLLQMSSEANKNTASFNSNNNSFSPIQSNVMNNLLQLLETSLQSSDNITRRHKKTVAGKIQNDDSNSKVDEINLIGSCESDLNDCSRKPLNQILKTRKTNDSCSGNSKSKTPQHENTLPGMSGKKTYKKTDSTGKSICDATVNSKTHVSIEDLFGTDNEKDKNCLEVGDIQKKSKKSPISYSGEKEKSVNRNRRKLYDPTDSSQEYLVRDDREERNKRRNSNNADEFRKPDVILSVRAKRFVDKHNINVDEVLGDGNQKLIKKKRNTIESVVKHITGDDDEQHTLNTEILAQKCAEERDDTDLQVVVEDSVKKCNGKKKSVCAKIGTNKENMSDTFRPLPKPVKPAEKPAKRRCSVRLTQRFREISTDTVSRTEEKTRQLHPDEKSTKRRSLRLTQGSKKVHQNIILDNRGSTREFQPKLDSKKTTKIKKLKQPSIVCTKMHRDEIQVFSQIVKNLGGFFIENDVTRKTTHLVAGEPRRTVNMLRAIATGCWIVKQEWLFQSLEAGKWLPEEDFELTEFSPSVQQCRLQRQAFGASYSMDIFQDCGPVFISRGTTPRCSDLRELVSLCKGKCTNNARISKIAIGELLKYDGVICLKENWVLDSITFNRRMPFKNYIIPSSSATGTV